jgi:hypothetical protein
MPRQVVRTAGDDFAGLNEQWVRGFPADPPARPAARLPVKVERLKVSIAVTCNSEYGAMTKSRSIG